MEPAIKSYSVQDIKNLIDNIQEAIERFHIVSLNRQVEICKGLLNTRPIIDVAILGQFKAGKSSFINSIVGRNVLPIGVIPVTTVITRLQYGERERAIVTYFDGTTINVPLETLSEFISEKENPSNAKNVSLVDIELTSLDMYPGLRFVDTPGMGSVFKYHMEVSENWLLR